MDAKRQIARVLDPQRVARAQEENPFAKITGIVYSILEEAILSSALEPGSKLNITKIAEKLNVSATPVREALELLQANGFVYEGRGAGGRYRNYHVFDISSDSVADLFIARKSIESMAAYLCAQKNWTVDMTRLWQLANDFCKAWQDYADGDVSCTFTQRSEMDWQFHDLLVESTGNKYLMDMHASLSKTLHYLSVRTCEFVATEKRRDTLMLISNQHISICKAIEGGFPELAKSAMDYHLDFCSNRCLMNRPDRG